MVTTRGTARKVAWGSTNEPMTAVTPKTSKRPRTSTPSPKPTAKRPRTVTPRTERRQIANNPSFIRAVRNFMNNNDVNMIKLRELRQEAANRKGLGNLVKNINARLKPPRLTMAARSAMARRTATLKSARGKTPKTLGRPMTARGKTPKTARGKTPKTARGKTPKTPNRPVSATLTLQSKRSILRYLYTEISNSKSNKIKQNAFATLFSIIKLIDSTRLSNKFSKSQIDEFVNNLQTRQLSQSRGIRNHVADINRDQLVDMLFLMYLDGVHDEYITKQNFIQWLLGGYITDYINQDILKEVKNYAESQQASPLLSRFLGIEGSTTLKSIQSRIFSLYTGTRKYGSGPAGAGPNKGKIISGWADNKVDVYSKTMIAASWEKEFKIAVDMLFPALMAGGISTINSVDKILTSRFQGQDRRIYVAIDQESEPNPLSNMMTSKQAIDAVTNPETLLTPYVTLGVLLDPGSTMVKSMLQTEIQWLLSNSPSIGLNYDVEPVDITIKYKGANVLKIQAGNVVLPPLSTNTNLDKMNIFELKVNGKEIKKIGATKKQAQSNDNEAKMAKWLGDALQYLYLASKDPTSQNPRAFCSGDGMADVAYMFYSSLFGKTQPPLIVDGGLRQGMQLTFYNLSNYANISKIRPRVIRPRSQPTGQTGAVAGRNSPNGNSANSRYRQIESKTPGALNLSPQTLRNLLTRATALR